MAYSYGDVTLCKEDWSPVFVDFVNKCCEKEVEVRWSVRELMHVSVLSKSNE